MLADHYLLPKAELTLAKHVGPLASVLVRRAARECQDIGELYSKLAEQVSDPRAREMAALRAAWRGWSLRPAGRLP